MDSGWIQKQLSCACDGNLAEFKRNVDEHSEHISWEDVVHTKSKDTAAHIAARFGHTHLLEYLRDHCGFVNFEQENCDGKRPLHEAAQAGQVACVKYILDSGANVDSLKRADWTPLMLACTKKSLEVVKTLVDAGANVCVRNKDGWNCFQIACREGVIPILEHLLEVDSDLWNTFSNNKRSPMHTGALHGHADVIRLLLSVGHYTADEEDSCGTTPVMDAIRGGHLEVVRILAQYHKVNFHRSDSNGRQCVHLAAEAGMIDSIEYLLKEQHIDIDSATKNGNTPLHHACKEGQLACVEYLLDQCTDIDVVDLKGRSALSIAIGAKHQNVVDLLLKRGANIESNDVHV